MSNLGWYQVMTTAAKKVGGPKALGTLVALAGYGIGRLTEGVIKRIATKKKDSSEDLTSQVYEFTEDVINPERVVVPDGVIKISETVFSKQANIKEIVFLIVHKGL